MTTRHDLNERRLYALTHPFNGTPNWAETMTRCRWSTTLDAKHSASVVLAVDR